jgi:hypothetical protein
MEISARSMRPDIGYEDLSASYAISLENDLTRKGEAALDLIDRVADTISATENRLEARLLQALDQLKAAEDQNGVLTVRATEAEGRASEAVKWLRRLYDEVEFKLASQLHRSGSWAANQVPQEPPQDGPYSVNNVCASFVS